jgi:hypothetical protein
MIETDNTRPDTAAAGVRTAILFAIIGSIMAMAIGLVLSFRFGDDAWLVTACIMAFVGLQSLRMIMAERHHANHRENIVTESRAAINNAEAAQIDAQATETRVRTQIAIRQYKQLPAGVSAATAPITQRQTSAWDLRVTINYGSTRQFVTLNGKFIEAYVRLLRDGFAGDYRQRLRDEGVTFQNSDLTLIKQLMQQGGVYEGSSINREQLAALVDLWRTTGATLHDAARLPSQQP